ncbi:MAG: hypothetical protein ACKV2V_13445 [Blastocatellia bacterium]
MKKIASLLFLVTLLTMSVFAQGSGSSGTMSRGRAFAVTKTALGKIAEVKTADNILVIADNLGNKTAVRFDDKTKFLAVPGVRKTVGMTDFQAGQAVRVSYRAADRVATIVQMRKA